VDSCWWILTAAELFSAAGLTQSGRQQLTMLWWQNVTTAHRRNISACWIRF